jgi:hypothetical protein
MPEYVGMFDPETRFNQGRLLQCPYCDKYTTYNDDPLGDYESVEVECKYCERTYQVVCLHSTSMYCSPEITSKSSENT